MKKITAVIFCFLIPASFIFVSCKPQGNDGVKVAEKPYANSFPQDFVSDVAWIVVERNGKPDGYGSGFLISREHGAFYTNKHVTNEFNGLGRNSHKIFFNGKVYNAGIVKVPPLRDAAIIRITDLFDPADFPDPARISESKVKKGDEVYLEGFHPHPFTLIIANRAEGYDERIVPIYESYYNLGTYHIDKRTETVYEKITGKVSEIDSVAGPDDSSIVGRARNLVNTYIVVKSERDHKFSYGGLSGTVIKNTKGEIVGIMTLEMTGDFEKDEDEKHKSPEGEFVKPVFKTFLFTPIESVANLRKYLE